MLKKCLSVVVVLAALCIAQAARADDYFVGDNKNVAKSSVTIQSFLLDSTIVQVDTPLIQGGFFIEVQNVDSTNAVGCSFDSGFSLTQGAATGRTFWLIPKASAGVQPSRIFYRWANALKLWCASLAATGKTTEIKVMQGR